MGVEYLINQRAMNRKVSKLPGVKRAVDFQANQIGARAAVRLAEHRDEGNARIEVRTRFPGKYGKIDALVTLVDLPHMRADGSYSRGNAMAIEFGHIHNFSGEYIEGLYVLTGAVRDGML